MSLNKNNHLSCVYCSSENFELGKGSKEHVILSSLGGRKISRNICCIKCNIRYGNEIDVSMSEPYQHFSTMLGIKTGRNKDAPTIRNAGEIGGRKFNVLPKGEIEYSSPLRNVKETKKGLDISVSGRNEKELISLLSNIYKSNNIDLSKVNEIKAKSVLTKSPTIKGRFLFGESTQYRSVAKMLLTYMATMISPERLRSGIFQEIIDYIKGSKGIHPVWVETSDMRQFPSISNINHRIFIFASKSKRTVYGCLELFGNIRYSAILSNKWSAVDINKCYIINPITQESKEYEVEQIINIPIGFSDRRSLEGKMELLTSQFKRLIKIIEERQHKASQEEMLNTVFEKYNLTGLKDINESIFKQAINEYFERLSCIYLGTEFEEEISIQEPFNK